MRWGYKTVHYELKKEGFLGSAFLDEAEVEQSLNEYGRAGWELVSLMETQDGLIGVFKQPLDNGLRPLRAAETAAETAAKTAAKTDAKTDAKIIEEDIFLEDESDALITENDIIEDEEQEERKPEKDNGLHTIRIE